MRLVIDANALFSALIKDSLSSDLVFSNRLELIAPEFLLHELKKHRDMLISKTYMSDDQFLRVLDALKRRIKLVNEKESVGFLDCAAGFSPDPSDTPYFAVAILLGIPIWSNDKALKKQNRVKVYNTTELLKELGI